MSLMQTLAQSPATLDDVRSFGVAGLMGAMWLWERRTSRQREQQLDEAHARILADRVGLEQLMSVVRDNAAALTRLSSMQEEVIRRMEARKESES